MKKHLFLLLLAAAASTSMWASDTEVDGIWYNFDSSAKTASVTYRGPSSSSYDNEYSGSVVIPSSVTYNGTTYGVTSIGYQAFRYCTSLTSVTIPNSVTSIGESAFEYCTGLTSVTIPNSVTSIGYLAFVGCSSLTSVTIPNSVTSIGEWAFSIVPNIVYSGTATGSPWDARSLNGYVDGYLVYRDASKTELLACSAVATGEITIPNSVTSIGGYAFYECTGLTSVTIPNSVTSIGEGAFYKCTGLTSVTIPNSVTSIGERAFSSCSSLTSITIPNSVTSIGNGAFSYCISLTSVTIPNSVTSIGSSAFSGCSSLTSITIPNSVTSIGDGAFSGCSGLTSITLPNSVTSIGDYAFYLCKSLSAIFNYASSPQVIDNDVFGGEEGEEDGIQYGPVDKSLCKLYVPQELINFYKVALIWRDFKNILPIGAQQVDVTTTTVTPSVTTADIAWPQVSGAASYELVIKDKDGNVVCTLIFNAQGQLQSIAFKAPQRSEAEDGNRAPEAAMASGFKFTVTGLEPGTTYNYTLTVKDASDKVLDTKTGTFTTEGITAVENLLSQEELQALLANPATRIYNLQGNELTAMRDNLPGGVYILRLGNKAGKVVIR